ncbi:hypothetical protein [Fischerella sp.]|nr:hypothetical protein [Fischerella sp.]
MRDIYAIAFYSEVNSYLIKPVAFNALQEMMQVFNSYWLNFNQYSSVYFT